MSNGRVFRYFDGAIAGIGTASGTRLVIGMWPSSPLGAFADVMVERPDGHRLLIAPNEEVASFVRATYTFDEVTIAPVTFRRSADQWNITADTLRITLRTGRRSALGLLLRAVPRRIGLSRWWATLIDPIASRVVPGVHTRGSAGQGRREWYAALDLHPITATTVTWDGTDLGALRRVEPAVRFGFGSTPASPSLVRVRTTVELPEEDDAPRS